MQSNKTNKRRKKKKKYTHKNLQNNLRLIDLWSHSN